MGLGRNPNILLFSATRLEDILAEMVSREAAYLAGVLPSGSASSSGACGATAPGLAAEQLPGGCQEQCSRMRQAASLTTGYSELLCAVMCLPSV